MKATMSVKAWGLSLVCLVLAGIGTTAARAQEADDSAASVIVGRVYNVEGDLLRYVPETQDWVAMVADAPFGEPDTLSTGEDGRAELIVPNQTWVRIGNNTQIQFIDLGDDVSEVDMGSGIARFYNKSDNGVIKATCDFGYVLANAGTVFDLYVGDASVEVVALGGTVTFVHTATSGRYEVAADSPSLLADSQQVTSGDGTVDADWASWNAAREAYWDEKNSAPVQYADCLPPTLQEEAPVLEQQGQWDRVVYEGSERMFWRPTHVEVGWAPFTVGHWTEWNGDQIWVPGESFGYVTHHYGNWVSVESHWYWAPPVPIVRVHTEFPLLAVGFHWNPGRVSWIHSEGYVGWVPLAPTEIYYGHHHWGGRHTVFVDAGFHTEVRISSLAYVTHSVIVHENDYWDSRDYDRVRVRNINQTTIVNNYYAAPVVNNTVINNYNTDNRRFRYTDAVVREKPHNTAIKRIERNDVRIRREKPERAETVRSAASAVAVRSASRQAKVAQPKMTSKMVAAGDVGKPIDEVKRPQKDLKAKPTKPVATPKPARTPRSAGKPDQATTGKPDTGTKPAATPKPARPTKPGTATGPSDTVKPGAATKADKTPRPTPPSKADRTPKPTPVPKADRTPRPTPAPKADRTPRPTPPPKADNALKPTSAPKADKTPRPTPVPKADRTPRPTPVPKADKTPKPAPAPKADRTPRPTPVPKADKTPKPAPAPKVDRTPKPTPAPKVDRTPKPAPAPKVDRTPKPTPVPKADKTPKPAPAPKVDRTPKPTPVPKADKTPKPTPVPKADRTPKPTPTPKPSKGDRAGGRNAPDQP